jgi:hypothetical protein
MLLLPVSFGLQLRSFLTWYNRNAISRMLNSKDSMDSVFWDELVAEWRHMLGHQWPDLPPVESFWGALPDLSAGFLERACP